MIRLFFGAVAAIAVTSGAPAYSDDGMGIAFNLKPYAQLGVGVRYDTDTSGGFNRVGPNLNARVDETDRNLFVNAALGLDDLVEFGPVSLRLEVEAISGNERRLVTGSLPAVLGPPTFFRTTANSSWAGMGNLWVDLAPFENMPLTFSLGGGVGIANVRVVTTDLLMVGSHEDAKTVWSVGAQIAYDINETVTVGAQMKYMKYGSISTPLIIGTDNWGTYTIENDAAVGGVFLRVNLSSLLQ